ncbi:L-type lectin-domain containing receptor kinase IX.1-like [Herrania umbratica]|uniref:L-type lectin-domain containing receptor kinase IX.1-like n=1 Tax=Herrania umbratica TaxID=108875 RepID=A0A6J0ZHY8_9ROSI|nr:L-type lectin-domain containing receptor kinase IX.1-like [Herrania umbratica]
MAAGLYNLFYLPFIFAFFLFVFPSVNSVNFQISRFEPNDDRILYQGEASPSDGMINFNSLDNLYRVGWATYANRVPLWEPKTGKLSDFSTRFAFSIDISDLSDYGHGFVFFLAPAGSQIPPNSAAGRLGLFNTSQWVSTLGQVVLVEFDTYKNGWDPDQLKNHVGINNNSIVSAVYTRWNASIHNGDTADVLITYNATTKNLSASWSYRATNNPQENSSLSYQIDLMKALPEWVMIGFSAATGVSTEQHILHSWEFNSTLEREESGRTTARNVKIVVGTVVPLGVLVAGTVITLVIFRQWKKNMKRKTEETANLTSINDALERRAGPRRFSYSDLVSATNNFSEQRKLGEGGFGAVYRGYLPDLDMVVAVKRISRGSKQGKKEYVTEVKVISQLRHRNLVQLIGWCHDRSEFILVYEFMPNGSLDFHLFGQKIPLSWPVRYKISLGLASALLYLHEEWEQCVVHRDIKSSNVMLDSSFNVKLGDFGLARLMDHELGPKTTGLAGTLGYLAPEYVSTGRASKESDVYSFGVVLLEIATGRKSTHGIENFEMGLVAWVWDLYGQGKLPLAVDEKLNKEVDEKQVECLMIVGLWCAHPDSSSRPSIRQAIQVLNFDIEKPNLAMKMPVPTYLAPTQLVTSEEPLLTNSSMEVGR